MTWTILFWAIVAVVGMLDVAILASILRLRAAADSRRLVRTCLAAAALCCPLPLVMAIILHSWWLLALAAIVSVIYFLLGFAKRREPLCPAAPADTEEQRSQAPEERRTRRLPSHDLDREP